MCQNVRSMGIEEPALDSVADSTCYTPPYLHLHKALFRCLNLFGSFFFSPCGVPTIGFTGSNKLALRPQASGLGLLLIAVPLRYGIFSAIIRRVRRDGKCCKVRILYFSV